ncbi:complement C5 [Thalassophryne amazonica]|uniref:complement C5 n=1 Tax=Thalassophryne amazonica TaxID=390379 RepID=UPI001472046A|nr:complement C5 [Thalassophryne amazonica]
MQEAELATVKFVKSPYSLSLVSTPPFIKPGLPYNIQVLVKDHLDNPVKEVPVHLVQRQLFRQTRDTENMPCPDSVISQSDGLAIFICNTPSGATKAVLQFVTADSALPAASQASMTLNAVAYSSPNQRYLYIDPPLADHALEVGRYANIKVYSATPSFLPVKALSYLVISKGTVVEFGSKTFAFSADNKQIISFQVTGAMVPSIRLLVYYILYGEGTSELVADSMWLDVRAKCVNGLQTTMSYRMKDYRPKEILQLDIQTSQEGLVALSAMDSALFSLQRNFRDPVAMVLRHIESSDLGCGGGGGRDSADVFRLAGLTFFTNANAHPTQSHEPCTAKVRPKRELTEEQKTKKAESYGVLKVCCEQGMRFIPKTLSCLKYAEQTYRKMPRCLTVFKECCEFYQQHLDRTHILARNEMGADLDLVPSLVRSYFPESWLWEVQRAGPPQVSISRTLPDSLTTWQIQAVGMFKDGMCVADPAQVSVRLPLSVDVPLPYQVVRGEELELRGSVYNQQPDSVMYCVTLTVGPALCLLQSQPASGGLRSTECSLRPLSAGGVGQLSFILLGLEAGEHTLTFTLKTRGGSRDILEKKLRVVPEGVRTEVFSGGRLDPQGLYGSEKRIVTLKNRLPANIVPNTAVERLLTVNGEVISEILTVINDQKGLQQLVNLPAGSGEAELSGLLPLIQVYQYLEMTRHWDILGPNIFKNAANLRNRIKTGLISVASFRSSVDFSYSMWKNREPSTWLTAMVVKTLAAADPIVTVDHQSLSETVSWLIHSTQGADGSFGDKSSYRPYKVVGAGANAIDQSVYVTSCVLIALKRATSIKDLILQLQFHVDSMRSAASYISQHALQVHSVYARAVATYALTLHDPSSMVVTQLVSSLENLARQKGNPVELRYWQEPSVTADWLKPDQSSGLTVETTAYMLLAMLLKGRIHYASPILSWLTQDQHHGEGFYSVQDVALTLEAVTAYSRTVRRTNLDLYISIRYDRKGALKQVQLSQSHPVAMPIQVTQDDGITVSTGYGNGVANVKLKTVYYQTTLTDTNCNFDLSIEVNGPDTSGTSSMSSPHLVACAKYKPPPNEMMTESSLTVMKIQLPTGVEAHLDDLRQFMEGMEPVISSYELQGNTVVIQLDSVPSDIFVCVAFRIRTGFRVGGASESLFSVYEPQDRGTMCTKQFSYKEQKLQRLCVAEQCQCMTAACATYRGNFDLTLTTNKLTEEACKPQIKYAFRVKMKSSSAEGDFVTFSADVAEVLKTTDKELEAVSSGTEVEFVKKATCSSVDIQNHQQYMVMGAVGSKVTLSNSFRYRLPLDSDAVLNLWPTDSDCTSPECFDYVSKLNVFAEEMQLDGCPL